MWLAATRKRRAQFSVVCVANVRSAAPEVRIAAE
jgi:hypothetical protein